MTMLLLWLALAPAAPASADVFARGVEAYAAEEYERAIQLFEEAARLEPKDARHQHWLGKAAGRRAERVNKLRAIGLARKVRTAFERAVELEPSNVDALSDLFQYYLEAPGILGGGEEKARAAAARLAGLSPAAGHRAQAELLVKRNDHAGAEREFRQALELEPNRTGPHFDLAVFLTGRGRHGEAEGLLAEAGKIAPHSAELLFVRGKCLILANQQPQRARELLEQYLRSPRQPDDPPASEARDWLKKIPKKS